MKPRKSKKKSFFREKTEKNDENSYENDESSLPFVVGDEVLACWQDGLYYLAVIKTINKEKSKCQVSYEDDSIYWVLFKHIRTVAKNKGDVPCSVCDKMESSPQNDIIVCDSCFHGYHQACHAPVINHQTIESTIVWLCRVCVFSKAAKAGGALKDGSDADAMRALKGVLPYDLSALQWDAYHKSNTDEIFCYCGGPGLWYYKMLQCYHCHQWFHEACLQCLDFPLLLGDRFYYFVCAVCNHGQEYLKRIQLKWSDIAALVLYNLSLKYDKRGLKIVDIQRFLKEDWDVLQCGNLHDSPEEERMQKVVEVFKKQKHKFRSICVNGIVTWSLLNRTSPCPTKAILLHEAKAKSDSEMKSRFLDCNGNYLQASTTQDNSTTSNEVNLQNEASTSDALTSYQAPLFPSLSMFKYLFPNCGAQAHTNESPDFTSPSDRYRSDSEHYPTPGDKRPRSFDSADAAVNEPIEKRFVTYVERLTDGVTSYSGTNGRLACGEDCSLLGRRLARNGRIEYLVQWSGVTPDSF